MKAKINLLTIRANNKHDEILFAAIDDGSEQSKHMLSLFEKYGVDYVSRTVEIECQPWPWEVLQT